MSARLDQRGPRARRTVRRDPGFHVECSIEYRPQHLTLVPQANLIPRGIAQSPTVTHGPRGRGWWSAVGAIADVRQ
jgi:hypothetical protein